jgi:hypothetical protein
MFEPPPPLPPPRRSWGCLSATIAIVGLLAGGCVVMSSMSFRFGFGPDSSSLPDPPPAKYYGTAREIGTRGDDPNPRAVYHGVFPSDEEVQERSIGGSPARFSGYTTWVDSVTRVPAHRLSTVYGGSYLRVHVTVFNRDVEAQHVCACDFLVWTRSHGYREADAVTAPDLAPDTAMQKGARRAGDVYLYVGHVTGPYFVVFDPDAHVSSSSSTARGVWEVPRERAVSADGSRSTSTGPPPTPS